jgi:6-phospho-3-hexuloisomerase
MIDKVNSILFELNSVFKSSDLSQLEDFTNEIISADKIVLFGAGRVGLMMKSFSMRLNHLGFRSFFIGETNVPKTGENDLLIVGSGSGNTLTVADIVSLAKKHKLSIVSITANADSIIAKSSKSVIRLSAPTKESKPTSGYSIQPMTTLFEQALLIATDAIVLSLMEKTGQSFELMKARHNNLE